MFNFPGAMVCHTGMNSSAHGILVSVGMHSAKDYACFPVRHKQVSMAPAPLQYSHSLQQHVNTTHLPACVCSNSVQTPQQQSTSQSSVMQSPASTPDSTPSTRDGESPGSVTLQMKQQYALNNQRTPPTPDVRLYHRAVVVAQDTPGQPSVHPCACV